MFGARHVPSNLLSQFFYRAELYFIPHPRQERNPDFSLCGYFQWMKVQEVAFNGE